MLEVDIDIRRFVALPGDEPLEQYAHAGRVHLGDAQAVTDRRVGRRTPSLAEDAAAAGEGNDVVHREEKVFVAEFGDQPQFVGHQVPHLLRCAPGPALCHAGFGQGAQMAAGGGARRHQLPGVFVAQLIQGKAAASGDALRLGEPGGGVELRQALAGAQVALAVGVERIARPGQRGAEADGGQGVLQRPAAAAVHVHLPGRHQRQTAGARQRLQGSDAGVVVRPAGEGGGDPGAVFETAGHPAGRLQGRAFRRHQQGQKILGPLEQVGPAEAIISLVRGAPAGGDQPAEVGVTAPAGGQQHQPQAVRQGELAADNQAQPRRLGRHMGAHRPGHRAVVRHRQGAVTQLRRPGDQLLGVGGAAQEAEIGQTVQFGVGEHGSPVCGR